MNFYTNEYETLPVSVLRKLLTGKMFLFIVAFQAVTFVFDLISALSSRAAFTTAVIAADKLFGASMDAILDKLKAIAPTLDTAVFSINLISLTFPALIALGCLMLYLGAKKQDNAQASAGALICRIYCALRIISTSAIIIALAVLVNVITGFSLLALVNTVAIIFMILLAFIYVYFAKLFTVLGGIQKAFRGDENAVKHSDYVILGGRIWVALQLIVAIRNFPLNLLSLVPEVCTALCVLFISELLSKFKKSTGVQ